MSTEHGAGGGDPHRPRWRRWAIALLVVVAVTAAVLPLRTRETADGLAPIVAASASLPYRRVAARLGGGFPYRPLRAGARSEAGDATRTDWKVLEAAAAIQQRTEQTQEALHRKGVANLLLGEQASAVSALERALRLDTGESDLAVAMGRTANGALLSDLSAAYSARGRTRDFAPDFVAALNASERAVALTRKPETLWNLALASSDLHLPDAAEREWRDVLTTEPDPRWRSEAAERLRAIRRPGGREEWELLAPRIDRETTDLRDVAERHGARLLRYFQESLLPAWATARLRNDRVTEARTLAISGRVADALAAAGEKMPAAVLEIRLRVCATDAGCERMAAGVVDLAAGFRLFREQRFGPAADRLLSSERAFSTGNVPLGLVARLQRIACLLNQGRFGEARGLVTTLRAQVEPLPYRNLRARTRWLFGLLEFHAGDPENALAAYAGATELFSQGGDPASVASMYTLMADALEFVGDPDEADRCRLRALAGIEASGERDRLHIALFETGYGAVRRELPFAAERLFQLAESAALDAKQYDFASMSALWRARIAASRADFPSLQKAAHEAKEYAALIADPGVQARVTAQASTAQPDPAEGTDDLTAAIRFFEGGGDRSWLPSLLQYRAAAAIARGDQSAAERDLRRAVELHEKNAVRGPQAALRDDFTADARAATSNLVTVLLSRGEEREALSYVERLRSGAGTGATAIVERSTGRIAPGDAIVVFELQPEETVMWLLRTGGMTCHREQGGSRAILPLLETLDRDGPSAAVLQRLSDLLVRPWRDRVPAGTTIALVSPPELMRVPFAALMDRETGRYLVQDFAISQARSIEAALSRRTPRSEGGVVIVGNPIHCGDPRLPAAEREALAVARNFDHPRVLLGEDATAGRILAALDGARVFHYAGHAAVNELVPANSALLVNGETKERCDGRLYIRDIAGRRLDLDLAVLSACSTARTRAGTSRGNLTIAKAFLDAGTAVVVGSLWPISDQAASRFSERFHAELREGESPARAVRAAQLSLLSTPETSMPLEWAAFCVFHGQDMKRKTGE